LSGDSGYRGELLKISITHDEHSSEVKQFFSRAKSRQETFNTRLKFFHELSGCFRHGMGTEDKLKAHQRCFKAVCVLVQYDIKIHPLFEV
jgi:hypothetical protein